MEDYFKTISDRKHQIDFTKFSGFMSSLIVINKGDLVKNWYVIKYIRMQERNFYINQRPSNFEKR